MFSERITKFHKTLDALEKIIDSPLSSGREIEKAKRQHQLQCRTCDIDLANMLDEAFAAVNKRIDDIQAPPKVEQPDQPTPERPWWLQSTVTGEYFCFTSNDNYQQFDTDGKPLRPGVVNIKYFTVSKRLPDETPLPVLAYVDMEERKKWRWYTNDPKNHLWKYSDSEGFYVSSCFKEEYQWFESSQPEHISWHLSITPEESATIEARLRGFKDVEEMLRADEKNRLLTQPEKEMTQEVNGLEELQEWYCNELGSLWDGEIKIEEATKNVHKAMLLLADCIKGKYHTREAELQEKYSELSESTLGQWYKANKNLESKLATAEKERDEAQRKLEAAMNEKYATEAQSEVEQLRKRCEHAEQGHVNVLLENENLHTELTVVKRRCEELRAEVEGLKTSNLITPTKIIVSNGYVESNLSKSRLFNNDYFFDDVKDIIVDKDNIEILIKNY